MYTPQPLHVETAKKNSHTCINTAVLDNNIWLTTFTNKNPHSTLHVNTISHTYILQSFIFQVSTDVMILYTIDPQHVQGEVRHTFMVCLTPMWSL